MKLINLFGDTVPEKLKKIESAINDLYGAFLGATFLITEASYDPNVTYYSMGDIITPKNIPAEEFTTDDMFGRAIYFSGNGYIAVIHAVDPSDGMFTVTNPYNLKGEKGDIGLTGATGAKGDTGAAGVGISTITGENPVQENGFTKTPIDIVMTDGSMQEPINIYAKNGQDGVPGEKGDKGLTGTGVSHFTAGEPYVSGNKTITPINIEYTDGTTQSMAIQAQNGADGGVVVDSALSKTSENPVQNKVITKNLTKPLYKTYVTVKFGMSELAGTANIVIFTTFMIPQIETTVSMLAGYLYNNIYSVSETHNVDKNIILTITPKIINNNITGLMVIQRVAPNRTLAATEWDNDSGVEITVVSSDLWNKY